MKVMKEILSSLLCIIILFGILPISAFAGKAVNGSTSNNTKQSEDVIPTDATEINGHYYMLYDGVCSSMEEAKEYCEQLGGHLAIIDSYEENCAVYEWLLSLGYRNAFFGLTDSASEGTWLTVNGTPPQYTNWHSGEPNSESSGEDWAMFYQGFSNGQWNDANFTRSITGGMAFICEWGAEPSVTIPDDAQNFQGHHYKVFDLSMTWKEAKAYCESLGGHLATITSLEEQNFITSIYGTTTKTQLWLGGTDEFQEGNWQWITGEDFVYQNWHSSNQDNFRGNEHYLTIFTENTPHPSLWNDFANVGYISSDISGLWFKLEQIGFICEWDTEPSIQIPNDATSYNGHSYKVYTDSNIGWHDAKVFCENLGGHLATITSAEEDAFIYSLVQNSNSSYWLGATDEEIEGEWQWVTGEAWDYSNASFDNRSGLQHYLTINYHNGQVWDDQSEKSTSQNGFLCNTGGFICEWDDSYDTTKKVVIYDREFDKNIDYYTTNCDSSEYNPTLANMLAALSAATYDKNKIQAAYESLGFEFNDTKKYGSYDYETEDPWLCGYSISFKDSEYNDDIVCLITVRGSKLLSDWLGNVDIFTVFDEKHEGFFMPALSILNHINSIIEREFVSEDVKYVITGHSRGAAVGNLLAVALMETGTATADDIYNYNFACPDVACQTSLVNYTNIFNLCNTEDIVPFVPGALCDPFVTQGSSWGKYGQTLWFTALPTILVNTILNTHDVDLYLSFFDNQLHQEDWPTISWKDFSGTVIKVFCPVDVVITDENGNQVASVINGEVVYSDSSFEKFILVFTDGDKKVVYINGDVNFNIDLIGTDDGAMTFTLGKYDLATGELSESKTFNDVVLEEGKTMYCSVDETTDIDNVSLFVVEEKEGEMIYTHTIGTDGTEIAIPCEHEWNDGEITKQPSHTDFGEATFTCDDCGATKTERIEKTTVHTYGYWVKIDDTIHKHTCECGEYETENHVFGDWVITKEASESETGAKEKSCVCGHAVTEEIPKKVVETDPFNPSTDGNDSNGSEPPDTLGDNNDASIFDMLESIPKKTIIIVSASIAGVILLVIICIIVKKKRF